MEPFGLLNFLQTLLSSPNFSKNAPVSSMENKENIGANSAENSSNNSLYPQEKNASDFQEKPEAQNAFTQFMSAHDARVRNTKKRP